MADEFFIRHKDRTGVVKHASITDFLWLRYRNVVNDAGRLDFRLPLGHVVIDDLADFDQFEVWRRDVSKGLPWHIDFYAIYREPKYSTDDDGVSYFEAKCPGQMSILGYRQIAFPAGTTDRSTFTGVEAETVAKTLVTYNCTSSATVANGRHREGDLATGMGMTVTVVADQARGNVINKSFANGNVLRAIRESIAPLAGGDFALTKTGAAEWEFEFYPGQLGEDKSSGSSKVEFSLVRGNLIRPTLTIAKLNEATVAIVGGSGIGAARTYAVAEGADYSAANDIEMFVNASSETDDGLEDTGSEKLAGRRAFKLFDFAVLQTSQVFYSRQAVTGKSTYREGDLVSVVYIDTDYVRKVTAVEVIVTPSPSTTPVTSIRVETEDVVA